MSLKWHVNLIKNMVYVAALIVELTLVQSFAESNLQLSHNEDEICFCRDYGFFVL